MSEPRHAATAAGTIGPKALGRATLARQLLLERARIDVVSAVERLAGLQAQIPRPPFVGLWTRLEGFRHEDLAAAVDRRDVVRGTLMRATLHLVARRDFARFRTTLQPALARALGAGMRARLDGVDVDQLVAVARQRFSDGPCTFAVLREHVAAAFPGTDERVLGYAVRLHLPLVQVPADGARWTWPASAGFALAREWIGADADTEPREADAALADFFLRYLAAFGPASGRDFATWSGLPLPPAVLERLRPRLLSLRDERGRELLDLPDAPRPDPETPAPVRFLPEYDNLTLAYADRARFVDEAHRAALITRNLMIPGTVLVDGRVAGTWSVAVVRGTARLTLSLFGRPARTDLRTIREEGERLARFVEPEAKRHEVEV